jgi:hypothetical protein
MKGKEFYFNTEKLDKHCKIILFREKQGEDYRAFLFGVGRQGLGLVWKC